MPTPLANHPTPRPIPGPLVVLPNAYTPVSDWLAIAGFSALGFLIAMEQASATSFPSQRNSDFFNLWGLYCISWLVATVACFALLRWVWRSAKRGRAWTLAVNSPTAMDEATSARFWCTCTALWLWFLSAIAMVLLFRGVGSVYGSSGGGGFLGPRFEFDVSVFLAGIPGCGLLLVGGIVNNPRRAARWYWMWPSLVVNLCPAVLVFTAVFEAPNHDGQVLLGLGIGLLFSLNAVLIGRGWTLARRVRWEYRKILGTDLSTGLEGVRGAHEDGRWDQGRRNGAGPV